MLGGILDPCVSSRVSTELSAGNLVTTTAAATAGVRAPLVTGDAIAPCTQITLNVTARDLASKATSATLASSHFISDGCRSSFKCSTHIEIYKPNCLRGFGWIGYKQRRKTFI